MDLYDENIARLIRHSLTGELSEQEWGELEAWLHDLEEHRVLFEKIKKEIRISSESSLFCSLNDEVAWLKFKTTARERKRRVYVRRMLTYAAVIVLPLAVVVGFWFLSQEKDTFPMASERVVKITPGRPRAVLITADQTVHELNGVQEQREIEVEKGVMIKQGGANLEYDSLVAPEQEVALAMNTLKVPRGGEFRLKLSDGTNVYLNSASDLKYPVRFNEKERTVYLSGEAYFEVTRNEDKPFVVHTKYLDIEVLGTSFNVYSYERENVMEMALISGRIKIQTCSEPSRVVYLKPNEKALFNKESGIITVEKTDNRFETAWLRGDLVFRSTTLSDVLAKLERRYGVNIHLNDSSLANDLFTGNFDSEYIVEVMDLLERHYDFTYDVRGDDIFIHP